MRTGTTVYGIRSFAVAALLALGMPAMAEDIDLFVQPSPPSSGAPNVLILLDNTANWEQPFVNEIGALVSTVQNLPVNLDGSAKFRVGLMLFTETGAPNSNVDGGYVRAAIRDLTPVYKPTLVELLNNLHVSNDRSNGGKAGLTMAEAYYYFDGAAPRSGNRKVKTDFTTNQITAGPTMTGAGAAAANAIYALPGNALPEGPAGNVRAGTPYNSPIDPDSCGPNYIIYISNGAAQDNNSDTMTATTLLQNAASAEGIAGATDAIPISPSGSQTNVGDEWARFMRRSDHAITTYTLDVNPVTSGQGPGWSALLKSMANVSSGKYFSVSSGNGGEQIAITLNTIFSEIQAVNSVFASVSLPLSVSTQGTYLNQVYVGMFRPDQNGLARWAGNLKQYRLGVVAGQLVTVDAQGSSAINAATGFISECASSYWTTSNTYWTFRPQGNCIGANPASDLPDGNVTEKGGQGQMLRASAGRNMVTCTGFACPTAPTALPAFNTTNITPSMLGLASTNTAGRNTLVGYQRGNDVNDEDIDTNLTEKRASAHGDVVHSRPVAINYGTDAAPQVVVFYGGNDGVLRAINGNRTTAIGGVAAGGELWSFVAPEFFPFIKRLHENTVQISYYGNPTEDPVPQPKPYGLDGPITAYTTADARYIYSTARRGGRVVYAFDVTNLNTDISSPRLLWKQGCPNMGDDTGCTSGFSGIGQTWSGPKVMKTLGYVSGGATVPMIIMGGGYDPCEDVDGISDDCRSSSKGSKVYVMNAVTGELLKTFSTDRGVPADVFVVGYDVDMNPDPNVVQMERIAKYAYVVDLGGNIYRISGADANSPFGTTAPGNWTITKIAALGCSTPAVCTPNRKFMFMPDVVERPAPGSGTYYIVVGSGDREKPLLNFTEAYGVSNYFFMVKDRPADSTWLSDELTTCGTSVICLRSLTNIPLDSGDPDEDVLEESKGWYLGLHPHEQVVTSPITVFGTATFSTHTPTVPDPDSCESNLGTARVYNIGYLNANIRNGTSNRYEEISGGGLPPSPVAGLVLLDGASQPIPFVIGADPESPLQSREPTPPSTGTQPKSLTYWYIQR